MQPHRTQKSHATSREENKSCNLSEHKKSPKLLGQRNHTTSRDIKITTIDLNIIYSNQARKYYIILKSMFSVKYSFAHNVSYATLVSHCGAVP